MCLTSSSSSNAILEVLKIFWIVDSRQFLNENYLKDADLLFELCLLMLIQLLLFQFGNPTDSIICEITNVIYSDLAFMQFIYLVYARSFKILFVFGAKTKIQMYYFIYAITNVIQFTFEFQFYILICSSFIHVLSNHVLSNGYQANIISDPTTPIS